MTPSQEPAQNTPQILTARIKEISATAFDPGVAAGRYTTLTWPAVQAVAGALVSPALRADPGSARLHASLLGRLATWLAEACAPFVRAQPMALARANQQDLSEDRERDLRRALTEESVVAELRSFWALLAAGRGAARGGGRLAGFAGEDAAALAGPELRAAWMLVGSCLELGHGAADPAVQALFRELAASLAVSDEPSVSPIALDILSTFCVRGLRRATIAHASTLRIALNSLLLAQVRIT